MEAITIAEHRQEILVALNNAALVRHGADWPELVQAACHASSRWPHPVKPAEVEELYALRICDIFDPA